MTRVGDRIRCRFQQPQGHECKRPAVGTAYNRHEAADLPICLPCADRIDLPLTPYNGQLVTA